MTVNTTPTTDTKKLLEKLDNDTSGTDFSDILGPAASEKKGDTK
jgi:hypothetical protein